MDPESLFKQTSAVHVPPVLDLMKVSSMDEFVNLQPDTSKAKKKVRGFALLTPNDERKSEKLQNCE